MEAARDAQGKEKRGEQEDNVLDMYRHERKRGAHGITVVEAARDARSKDAAHDAPLDAWPAEEDERPALRPLHRSCAQSGAVWLGRCKAIVL